MLDDDTRIVLLRRTRPGREVYWTAPGGTVESDDASLEDALHRELAEELGAKVIWGSAAFPLFNVTLRGKGIRGTASRVSLSGTMVR